MKFCLKSPLILILLESIFICVYGKNELGLVEPTETTMIEMKPLFYSFDESNRGSKMNRLLKKNRKKDAAKHREAYRLFTSDGDNAKETTNGGEATGDASADGKVIKIEKGLAQLHKEHELDHLDHDSHSGEDKFVKMIWDKGDGFVKRWHWDRGEKVKENHSVAAKKHLEHHDKGKVDEHLEKQSGVVVHSKNDESSETNGIENMAKTSVSRDKETKNDDVIEQLKLKLLKQRLQQQHQQQGERSIALDGAKAANNNEDSDNYDVNGDNRIELLLGNQDSGEEADTDDNNNSISDHGLRRQNQYKEIFKKVNNDNKNEDEPRSKARRFPVRKQRNKNENEDENENNSSDESGDNEEGNKIKKHRDYHRKVTVREEKSELAAQERYRTEDKNNDESNKESDENNGDEGGNGYESGSKGSGYIKHYQLTSDGQKRSLNPLDFASIISDQSLQIKTAVAQDNGKMVNNKSEVKPSENLDNASLTRKRLLTQNHFQPNTLQMINPR